jgi:hypothetical protein
MVMKPLSLLILLPLAAACSNLSYGERVAATCASLGAPQGTPHYWDCVQQQVAVDQADRAMWGGTTAVGASLLYRPSPVYVISR